MRVEELVEVHPRIYHMAEVSAWSGIRRHGLLSTEALLDLYEVQGLRRRRVLTERRPESIQLRHELHGEALVRDNGPLSEKKLRACLTDLSVSEYLRLINSKVFFWPTTARLDELMNAKNYRDRAHLILTVDTASLLGAYQESVHLSPINSGATIHDAPARGSDTFCRVADFDFESWRKRRSRLTAIKEVCVERGVPDILDHLVDAHFRHPDGTTQPVSVEA